MAAKQFIVAQSVTKCEQVSRQFRGSVDGSRKGVTVDRKQRFHSGTAATHRALLTANVYTLQSCLLLHIVCLCSLISKIQEMSCNYLHEPPFCKFCKSKVQRLIAQNRRFRFKLEFKTGRVYFKMVQHAIAANDAVHGGHLIEFNAELRWCKAAKPCNSSTRVGDGTL